MLSASLNKPFSFFPSEIKQTTLIMDPLSYFSFQPVLHDWYNKGCGMC